jgi:hypothetical protein
LVVHRGFPWQATNVAGGSIAATAVKDGISEEVVNWPKKSTRSGDLPCDGEIIIGEEVSEGCVQSVESRDLRTDKYHVFQNTHSYLRKAFGDQLNSPHF